MSQTLAATRLTANHTVVLPNIDWRTYSRLLLAFAEQPGFRLTYDRGDLEIMAPMLAHDDRSRFLGWLVVVMTEAWGLPIKHGGSVTMRRRLLKRGIEADECFWIANAHRMAGRRRLDLRVDPPPDLAIEVDVSHSSLGRFGIYAALGVPEVWRLEGDVLTFHVLSSAGTYENASASQTFPAIGPTDLVPFLKQAEDTGDEHAVIREFREWLRERGGQFGN